MDYKYKVSYPLIAKRIKVARKRAGLTQEQLAEKIGISTNAVAKLENNLMTASLQTLVNIADVLGIDIDYLLCESYPTNRENNIDVFLNGLIDELSQQDKEFIIHVINGLKLYRAQDS